MITFFRGLSSVWFMFIFAQGIFQTVALFDGLELWLGLHWLIAIPVAYIVANIPIIGSVIGMYGAVHVWDWSWFSAFLLFCWPIILIAILFFGHILLEKN